MYHELQTQRSLLTMTRALAFTIALLVVPAVQAQVDPQALARKARDILSKHCHVCHYGEGSRGRAPFDVLKPDDLLTRGDRDAPLVIPGAPDKSKLYKLVRNERMPKDLPPLAPADQDSLKAWIAAKAPFPVAKRKPITLQTVLATVARHLDETDKEDRPHKRYFTLHQQYNDKQLSDADLQLYRAALSKALNSLSWASKVVVPQPLDQKTRTVFVIDLRDLDWDRNELWDEVLKAYPYGLKYRNHPNERLRKLDEKVCDLTGCGMPLIRADWFVATATRPPLYHTLLYDAYLPEVRKRNEAADKAGRPRPPMLARDLERFLKVDIAASFRKPFPRRIARAGFPRSGVSRQNRLLERHSTGHGSYWKSYDFKPGNPRSRLTRFPLGPRNLFPAGKHPYPREAFVHDGGEIIFNLPNGLQGYLLINGKDERIDEGPTDVVRDLKETSGSVAIVNGVSCMGCHKDGMIGFRDTLRNGSAVFGPAEAKVRLLYPEARIMEGFVREDTERFGAALRKAIGPFPPGAADKEEPRGTNKGNGPAGSPRPPGNAGLQREQPEPIGEVAWRHRLIYLDLERIARELDVKDPKDLVRKVGERKLKALGLEGLLKKGGVVGRLDWEAAEGVSLMQEVARELRYTPWGLVK
jgi:serine/threonine-protein kinase